VTAPNGSPVDRRHPAWCSYRRCSITTGQGIDHRSEAIPVERVHDFDLRAEVWLTMHLFEPPERAEVWAHVRVSEIGTDGEVERITTEDLHIVQAEQLGSILVLLARRGAEGLLVSEDDWRAGTTRAPRREEPGNSGPGYYPDGAS
jgi:hypothetical protein